MATPDSAVMAWASAVLGGDVTVVGSLRLGGSPWLLQAADRRAVVRVVGPHRTAEVETEAAALTRLARAAHPDLPVAQLLGYDLAEQTRYGLTLIEHLPGTSSIPATPDRDQLRALGAVAARISSITATATQALPARTRPIEGEDFAGMRRDQGMSELLRMAEVAVAGARPDYDRTGLVHGDMWHGNTLWDDGGRLTAVLDWDCAGVGSAGLDLGSLRCDAAWCHGLQAADDILAGWEAEAGRAADDVPYWDAVAALTSPPDMGWFPESMGAQGRPDLTNEVMLDRRDAFLTAALSQLATTG